jgi:membrane protein
MTAVGAFGLIVTSLLLMYSIDSALNTIWRSTRTRPKTYSFAVYWMILTLGPLLAGPAWRSAPISCRCAGPAT